MKVVVTFLVADLFHQALNADHPFQLDPVKLQRGKRVAGQFLALAAVVIGKPGDAALVIALDEYHACAGAQVAAHGGQGHGIGFGHLGRDGLGEPLGKLLERVGVGGVLAEFSTFVTFSEIGK